MRFHNVVAIMIVALMALPVSARDKADAAVNASSKDAFQTVSSWVRKEMDAGGRYSYVTADERTRINAKLDEMGRLFDQKGEVEKMSGDEKVAMFNSQEEVNAILAKRDNDRLICKNDTPIGSHIPVKTCSTAGEIEARRRNDSQYLLRNQNTAQQKKTG
jgi:hypothetical protein